MEKEPHGEKIQECALAYEPDRIYDVRLARAVRVGAMRIQPLSLHQMTGVALNGIIENEGADAIVSAIPR